jgi:hypothetical protein
MARPSEYEMLANFSPALSFRSQFQPEADGQSIRHVEPKGLRAAYKPHNARPRDARFPLQSQITCLTGFNGATDRFPQ